MEFNFRQSGDRRPALILFLVLLMCVLVFSVLIVSGALGRGSKVTITGHVTYTPFPSSWSATYYSIDVAEDPLPFTFAEPLGFLNTGHILVIAKLDGGSYQAEAWLGTVSSVTGGGKDYTVTLRHVEPGYYSGIIEVWEVQKGFFGIGEESRDLRTSITFAVEVIGEIQGE